MAVRRMRGSRLTEDWNAQLYRDNDRESCRSAARAAPQRPQRSPPVPRLLALYLLRTFPADADSDQRQRRRRK